MMDFFFLLFLSFELSETQQFQQLARDFDFQRRVRETGPTVTKGFSSSCCVRF
jgi:hypothetical protein